tara:strand:+ start:2806 stop:3690 length:885 start_codon:yes stop_codon:yes gene_type:complete
MSTAAVRSTNLSFRVLDPSEQGALEIFLERHWSSSVTLLAYVRAGGLQDQGQAYQGTYVGAWDGATLIAVAVHYTNGIVVVQASQSLTPIVRMAVAESRRSVTAIQGPWSQVEAAVGALAVAPRTKFVGRPQTLSTLDLSKLQVPDAVKSGKVKVRNATAADIPKLVPWIVALQIETSDAVDTPELRARVSEELSQQAAASGLFVAETDRIVATACFEIWSPPTVKIGGVYSPPALKDKAYGACAAFGALHLAQSHGVKRAVILCDRNNMTAQKSYRALGFTALNDYGVLRYTG